MRTRLIKKHRADCRAVALCRAGDWDTPWAYILRDGAYYGDLTGRRGNGCQRWVTVRCNCTDCGAILAILEDDILRDAEAARYRQEPKETSHAD